MNGVTFISADFLPGLDPASGWSIVGVGDFNYDVWPDILWRNTSTGQNRVWYMNGTNKTGEALLLPLDSALNWIIVGG
jgi:hypothetical protein